MRTTNILLTIGLLAALTQAMALQFRSRAAERQAAYLLKKHNLLTNRNDDSCDDESVHDQVAQVVAQDQEVAPNSDGTINIPVNANLRNNKKKHSNSDHKQNQIKVNGELIDQDANKATRSENLIDNEGQPKLKFKIPIQRTGADPENIVAPLEIDQSKVQAKAYKKQKAYHYKRSAMKRNDDQSDDDIRAYIRGGAAY